MLIAVDKVYGCMVHLQTYWTLSVNIDPILVAGLELRVIRNIH